jgi:hypothetical protein
MTTSVFGVVNANTLTGSVGDEPSYVGQVRCLAPASRQAM